MDPDKLPNKHPQQKVVLISGATRGIGRETALLFARSGKYRVYAGYRNKTRGNSLLAEAKKANLPLKLIPLDITKPESNQAAVDFILKDIGRLDILINNAGFGLAGALEDLTLEEIKDQFETNVFGNINLTQTVIPHLRKQRSGTVLFMSSMAGLVAYPLFGAYCASKHAIEGFAEALRYELKIFGVNAVLLEPGKFKTDFVKTSLKIGKDCATKQSPYYKPVKNALDEYYKMDDKAPSASQVAKKILKIMETKKPRLRYRIGADSQMVVGLKRILPAGMFEAMVTKALGMSRYNV